MARTSARTTTPLSFGERVGHPTVRVLYGGQPLRLPEVVSFVEAQVPLATQQPNHLVSEVKHGVTGNPIQQPGNQPDRVVGLLNRVGDLVQAKRRPHGRREPKVLDHRIPPPRIGLKHADPQTASGSRTLVRNQLRGNFRPEQSSCAGDLLDVARDLPHRQRCVDDEVVFNGHPNRSLVLVQG